MMVRKTIKTKAFVSPCSTTGLPDCTFLLEGKETPLDKLQGVGPGFCYRIKLLPAAENKFLASLLVFPRPAAWFNSLRQIPAMGTNLENVPHTSLLWGENRTDGYPCLPVPVDSKLGLGFVPFLAYPEGTDTSSCRLPGTGTMARGLSTLLRSARSPPGLGFAKLSAWAAAAEEGETMDPAKLDTAGCQASIPQLQWCEYSAQELEAAREAAKEAAATAAAAAAAATKKYSWQAREVEGDPLASLNMSLAGPQLAHPAQPPQLRRDPTGSSGWESLMSGGSQPVVATGSGGVPPPPGYWPPYPAMAEEDRALWRQRWDFNQDPMSLDSEPPAKASRPPESKAKRLAKRPLALISCAR